MTGRPLVRLVLLVAALSMALVPGCGLGPGSSLSGRSTDGDLILSRARDKAAAGRLADALVDYKALSLLRPDDPQVREERARLEKRISKTVGAHFKQGRQAAARGQTKVASRHFLAVLAADPRHRGAFLALRDIETVRARRVQQQIGPDTPRAYETDKSKP